MNMELLSMIVERPNHRFFDEEMNAQANKIGIHISPIRSRQFEILTKFESTITVPFYRDTIHEHVKKLFSKLYKKGLITFGLLEFQKSDNYLSPFSSYPMNNPTVLLFSDSFKRIYDDFYLMKKNDLKRLFKRASDVYIMFADLLFDHFRTDPPMQHDLELWVKQFIFQWNLSANNFDVVWEYLNELYEYELGSGKFYVFAEGVYLNVIDLETNKEVEDYQEVASEEDGISQPFDAPFLHHLFAGLDTDIYNPYMNLISCNSFRDIGKKNSDHYIIRGYYI